MLYCSTYPIKVKKGISFWIANMKCDTISSFFSPLINEGSWVYLLLYSVILLPISIWWVLIALLFLIIIHYFRFKIVLGLFDCLHWFTIEMASFNGQWFAILVLYHWVLPFDSVEFSILAQTAILIIKSMSKYLTAWKYQVL